MRKNVVQSRDHDAATHKEFIYDSADDANEESDAKETVDKEDPPW
jgi:hypothetical protein